MSIHALCDDLLSRVTNLGSPVARYLNPGADPAKLERSAGVLPPEARELLSWRDGTQEPSDVVMGDLFLLPGFLLLSFEAATEIKEINGSLWPKSWFPLFWNGGNDYQIVEAETGAVISAISAEEPVLIHRSVRALLETSIACYDAGAYFWTGTRLKVDRERWREIGQRLNPDVEFWA